jgi:AHBA synthesis associated protein
MRATDPIPLDGLRAVIFDLDGVLVDSAEASREAFAAAYAEVVGAGPAPVEEYARYAGWHFPDVLADLGLPAAMELPFVRASYRLADKVRVHTGVPAMLSLLRWAGIRTAVATGKSGERARWLLDRLHLLPLLDAVIGSDEVARAKPAPDITRRALATLGVPAQAAVLVGDAPADLASARAAGVIPAAALWGESTEAELRAADPELVLRRPHDVLTLCRLDRRTARVVALTGVERRYA